MDRSDKEKIIWAKIDASNVEQIVAILASVQTGKNQLIFIEIAEKKMEFSPYPGLADQIIAQLNEKVAQYGEKAYPLSPKQAVVVATHIKNHFNINL